MKQKKLESNQRKFLLSAWVHYHDDHLLKPLVDAFKKSKADTDAKSSLRLRTVTTAITAITYRLFEQGHVSTHFLQNADFLLFQDDTEKGIREDILKDRIPDTVKKSEIKYYIEKIKAEYAPERRQRLRRSPPNRLADTDFNQRKKETKKRKAKSTPEETTVTLKRVKEEPADTTEPVHTKETTSTIESTNTIEPVRTTETTDLVSTAEITKPVEPEVTTQPINTVEKVSTVEPVNTTQPLHLATTKTILNVPQYPTNVSGGRVLGKAVAVTVKTEPYSPGYDDQQPQPASPQNAASEKSQVKNRSVASSKQPRKQLNSIVDRLRDKLPQSPGAHQQVLPTANINHVSPTTSAENPEIGPEPSGYSQSMDAKASSPTHNCHACPQLIKQIAKLEKQHTDDLKYIRELSEQRQRQDDQIKGLKRQLGLDRSDRTTKPSPVVEDKYPTLKAHLHLPNQPVNPPPAHNHFNMPPQLAIQLGMPYFSPNDAMNPSRRSSSGYNSYGQSHDEMSDNSMPMTPSQ